MQCPTCGLQIDQPGMERCPRCGQWLGASPGQPAQSQSDTPRSDQGTPPPGYEPTSPTNPYGQYGSYAPPSGYGQPAPPSGYGQPYGPYGSYAPPSGYGQPAPPSGYGQYGQYAPPSYPLQPGYPPPGYPQQPFAPPPQRKSRTGLIVGIVVAVVVVLVACTGGTLLALRSLAQSPTTTLDPTATLPSATATSAATPTVAGTVLYQNTFASEDNGWKDDQINCFLKDDGYHVANNYSCYAPVGVQTDVNVSVAVRQVSGPTTWPYGIMFRLDNAGNDYQFMIDSNSKWVFVKCTADKCAAAVDYTHNAAIHGGLNTSNTLELHARGSHFDFFVNGTKVGGFDDSTYPSGEIGLAAGSNVECAFTNLVITRAA